MEKAIIIVVMFLIVFTGCVGLDSIIPGNKTDNDESSGSSEPSTGLKEIDFSTVQAGPEGNIKSLGKFIAAGYPVMNNLEGLVQVSEDGYIWETMYKCKDMELEDIIHAYGKIVAVGAAGVIFTSDGENWNLVQDAINFETAAEYDHSLSGLSGIGYGDGMFVAVGTGSRIIFSKDGETWVHSTIDSIDPDLNYAQTHLKSVNFINGKFYITGNMNRVVILRKDDVKGLVMESNTSLGKVTSVTTDIEYGNGIYFLVGTTNDYYSFDCVNWEELDGWMQVYNLIYQNGIFFGVTGFGDIVSSEDGTSWEILFQPLRTSFSDIVYAENMFVAAGRMGAVYISADGYEWEQVDTGESHTINSLIYID